MNREFSSVLLTPDRLTGTTQNSVKSKTGVTGYTNSNSVTHVTCGTTPTLDTRWWIHGRAHEMRFSVQMCAQKTFRSGKEAYLYFGGQGELTIYVTKVNSIAGR